jgi:PAS domain S-box-containing protein
MSQSIPDIRNLSREAYVALLDCLPVPALVIDGETVCCNRAAEQLTGYDRHELATLDTWFRMLCGEDHETVRGLYEADRAAGFPSSREVSVRRKDGSFRVLDSAWSGGYPVLGIMRDVTSDRRATEVMEARLRLVEYADSHTVEELLVETLNEAEKLTGSLIGFYHHLDEDQQTLSLQAWSTRTMKEFCRANGNGLHYPVSSAGVWVDCIFERQPVIHNDYASLPHRKGLPEGHADVVRELVVPVIRGERVMAILGVGNKPHDYEKHDVNTVMLLADMAWDIADRKRMEQEIAGFAGQFRVITRTTLDGFWVVDLSGRIVETNDECCRMYGYKRDELIGMTLDKFEAVENIQEIQAHTQRIISAGYDRFETRHLCRDGRIIDVEISTTFMPNRGLFLAFSRDISERKEAEESLRSSERLLREAQRVGHLGTYDFDIVADRWSSSPQLDALFGIDETSPRAFSDWLTIVHPDYRPRMGQYFAALRESKQWFEMEYPIVRPLDGTERWVYGTGEIIRDVDGTPLRMFGTIQDITARKSDEKRLRESEERYRRFSTLTSDYVYSCMRRGNEPYRVRWIGGAVEAITGYGIEEISAKGCWLPIVHPDDLDRVAAHLRSFKAGESGEIEFRVISKSGEIRWIEEACSCEAGIGPDELVLFGTSRDISERKTREESILRLSQALVRLAQDTRLYGTGLESALAVITEASSEAIRARRTTIWVYGESAGQLGITCRDLYDQETRGHSEGAFLAADDFPAYFAAAAEGTVIAVTDAVSDPRTSEFSDGYLLPNRISSMLDAPIIREGRLFGVVCHEHSGPTREWTPEEQSFVTAIGGFVATIFEFHDRKQATEKVRHLNEDLEKLVTERTSELEVTNRELAGFCYAVSHELRAPIARLQGFSSVLAEEAPREGSLPFIAERIELASRQLQSVVDAILMLSRLSRVEMAPEEVNLSELVRRAAEANLADYPERAVELVVPQGITVRADLNLMTVCIENLVGNAVKYSSMIEAPRIEFGIMHEQGETVYYIRDNGAGFDMSYADKLYVPFQRLHQQAEFPGMGVGLATVQKIIERHHGRLWAIGCVGEGATFYFTLH